MDALSQEIEDAAHRVRVVQRKRFLVTSLSVGIAAVLIGGGEGLIFWWIANARSVEVNAYVFALPFFLGLPAAWAVRQAMWPKDPVI
jgi:apolipoprotein N-acyltransferase